MIRTFTVAVWILAACVVPAQELLSNLRVQKRPWEVLENTVTTTTMRLYAVRAPTPPTLDGKLDEPVWQSAFSVSTFGRVHYKGYTPRQNSARFLYDDQALYIGCCGELTAWTEWLAQSRERDRDVWKDEAFEVFIDPKLTRSTYYQFIVNALGTQQDGKGWDGKYNASWQVAVSHTDKQWIAEIMIPFAALQTTAPARGEIWGLNLCRDDKEQKESSSVMPVPGSFHDPKSFAEIEFGDVPQVYLDQFQFDRIVLGDNVLRFKALGSGVAGTKVRGVLSDCNNTQTGAPREVELKPEGLTEFPFTLTAPGRSTLNFELLNDGKVLSRYSFYAIVYEAQLVVLVPGARHFYQTERSCNLRVDLRLKESVLKSCKARVSLKQDGKLLRSSTVDNIPGVFCESSADISGLALGKYQVEIALLDATGQEIARSQAPLEIIAGPFAD